MTEAQKDAIRKLCSRYNVPFVEAVYNPTFDLPDNWVAGWVGPIYIGCSPEGGIHS